MMSKEERMEAIFNPQILALAGLTMFGHSSLDRVLGFELQHVEGI
jgi:hypothetical protein